MVRNWVAGLLGVGCYLTKFPLSRGFYFLLFIVGVPALIFGRLVMRWVVQAARRIEEAVREGR